VVRAIADGIVTDIERRDLNQVSRLLGESYDQIETLLETAMQQLQTIAPKAVSDGTGNLTGKTVCFTGELMSRKDGQPISRGVAEALAEKRGLIIASNVSKKLDVLVVADPNTQSGKAKKARDYGVRILAEPVFWGAIGVTVD